MMDFPIYKQKQKECGPACLYMIARYYGKKHGIGDLKRLAGNTKDGSTLMGLSRAAEQIGFKTDGVMIRYSRLAHNSNLPCIVYINASHYVVVYRIKAGKVYLSDPANGSLMIYSKKTFLQVWAGKGRDYGVALLLEPAEAFVKLAN